MAQTNAIDVSQYQGDIDWAAVEAPIAIIKMTGGDDGLYVDSKANRNYYGAKAAGKAVGMYHFAGGKDPVNEADFFIAACSPLEDNDVMILDWELNKHPNPVQWCHDFIQRIIDRTHTVPMIYMSASRLVADRDAGNAVRYLDWSPVVRQDVGLWVAHYGVSPENDVPIKWFPTYIMHQYTDVGPVAGVPTKGIDQDVWFGSVDQFKKYGFHAPANPQPQPQPVPDVVVVPPATPSEPVSPSPEVPAETPAPDDTQPPAVDTPPVSTPVPPSEPVSQPPIVVVAPNPKTAILTALTALAAAIAAILAWLHS